MRRQKAKYGQLGTVSHGTMRTDDLIPVFLDVAEGLRLSRRDRADIKALRNEWEACEHEDGCKQHSNPGDSTCDNEADSSCERLFDILNNYAPPYCYFGSHEGDGSDYGFWVSQDSLDEAVRDGDILRKYLASNGPDLMSNGGSTWNSNEDAPDGLTYRYLLTISDHGNMTLYYRNGHEVWGVV
jgi:hypothetical protein